MIELEDWENGFRVIDALEATSRAVVRGRWDSKLDPELLYDILWYRDYWFNSVRDLLRVIRNKLNHYRELPTEIQVFSLYQALHFLSFF